MIAVIPDQILLTVMADDEPAQGLLVRSELIMSLKNNYTCLHGPSDPDGSMRITAKEINAGIDLSLQIGLMDHARIEHFSGVTNITPLNRDDLCLALQGHETWSSHCSFPAGYLEILRTGLQTLDDLLPSTLRVVVESHNGSGRVIGMSRANSS